MKNKLTLYLTCCVALFYFMAQAQITFTADPERGDSYYEYLFHWDQTNINLFGYLPYLVRLNENPRVPESGRSFTRARNNDSFGYRITGVSDWDSNRAINALNNGTFIQYLDNLSPDNVDGHTDSPGTNTLLLLGTGVGNSETETAVNRKHRMGMTGEALILTFDTTGRLETDETLFQTNFVPEDNRFINTGLDSRTALRVSDLHIEPGNQNNNDFRRVDYFIYDASENTILSNPSSDSGMELSFQTKDTEGTINKAWTIDDGDMIILAYVPPAIDLDETGLKKYAWGLWSLKLDLIEKPTLSNNSLAIDNKSILYPNPASSDINIHLNKTYKNILVTLYSIDGRELLTHEYSSNDKISIDIESLKNGSYFLILSLDDTKSTFKVLKK